MVQTKQAMTADAELGLEVLDALIDGHLVPGEKREEILPKLIAGTISQDDWRLYVEMAEESEGGSDNE